MFSGYTRKVIKKCKHFNKKNQPRSSFDIHTMTDTVYMQSLCNKKRSPGNAELLFSMELYGFLLHDYLNGRSRVCLTDNYSHYAAVDVTDIERAVTGALGNHLSGEVVDLY